MQSSSFFNAQQLPDGSYDRSYNATNWAEYFASFITNGVSFSPSSTLEVSQGTGMQVIVNPGIAFINGYRYCNTQALTLPINQANSSYPRITSIILELNLNNRDITVQTLDGTPSSSPSAPTLTQTPSVYQIQLATVNIAAGSTELGTITDTRGDASVCGWMSILQKDVNGQAINASQAATFNALVTFNGVIEIGEADGDITFLNAEGTPCVTLEYSNGTFYLDNPITQNALISFSPVTNSSELDTLDVGCNLSLAAVNWTEAPTFDGNNIFIGENSTTNSNLSGTIVASNASDPSTGNTINPNINYNVQYWNMNTTGLTGLSNNVGIGVMLVSLTPTADMDWQGSMTLAISGMPNLGGYKTLTFNAKFDVGWNASIGALTLFNTGLSSSAYWQSGTTYTVEVLICQ